MSAIANIGSSTLAEQIFLRIGFLTYAILVARLGTIAFAAHQIGMNFMSISFSFGDGLSVASITLVGQSLGAGRKDMAKVYGSVCQRSGLLFACALSVIFLSCSRLIFRLFSNDEQILQYGTMIMAMMTVIVFLQISQVVFSGCLRGAGDTRYTALVSLISVAMFGAWLGLAVDQFMRFILTWLRFRQGKWMDRKI